MELIAELESRGLMQQVSDPEGDRKLVALKAKAQGQSIAAYVGFDPTADSLHLGNFLGIIALMYCQKHGIRPIAVVGGATGLIGDPGGKTTERAMLTKEIVAQNVVGVRGVLERFLDFNHPTAPASIVSNLEWFGEMSAIDFLRDVGRYFRVGNMLAKDSVKSRMEAGSGEQGMSYTEFSYQLLQGYDFYRLYKDHRCVLQMGGSDQWGNITAGTDLIRKLEGESGNAFALTWPLMTTSSGQKFGKSEGNAVWLSAEKTSPFDFYQFWLRSEDGDVERFLRSFTFLSLAEISAVAAEHAQAPERRVGQKRLADEVTRLVHGEAELQRVLAATSALFGSGAGEALTGATVAALTTQGVSTTEIERSRLEAGLTVIDVCVAAGLGGSKGEVRRLMQGGGIYVNNVGVSDPATVVRAEELIDGRYLLLRRGKKENRIVKFG
jgi:tyrosyl-tRNA synthetase